MYKSIIIKNNGEKYINDIATTIEESNKWIADISNHLNKLEIPFTVEGPFDLNQDTDWIKKDAQRKREKEYPSINQVVEALIEHIKENRPEKLNEIHALRMNVKSKYPIN